MQHLTPTEVLTGILAAVAVISLGVAGIGWVFKRGASERDTAAATRENTKATLKLTDTLEALRTYVIDQLHSHDLRLTTVDFRTSDNTRRIETLEAHERDAADRNTRSQG